MIWSRRKAQPKEWGDIGPPLPVESEWEVRQLTRQKMVGWILPLHLFPDMSELKSDDSMVGLVSLYVGRCTLASGDLCSEVFTREELRQFVHEEAPYMHRDEQGKLFGG